MLERRGKGAIEMLLALWERLETEAAVHAASAPVAARDASESSYMEVQGRLHFLGIPPELRLAIYHLYLEEHQRVHENRQPTNAHLRLLLISHQVCEEAQSILRQYISLKNERQIELFLWNVGDKRASCLTFADVANDGRVELSELSVKHLRVFEYEATPYLSLYQTVSRTRWSWQFEAAMYPAACPLRLLSYELYLSPEVRVQALEQIRSHHLRTLRLSGNCQLLREHDTSSLRNLIITGVTGSYFDQRRLDQCFLDAPLESFMYGMGHRLGFEIRNHHLQSLVSGPRPQHLRKLQPSNQ
ncbi:hypothetical protein GLOTRDRAFT_90141 [Gloeophyllum trabeum ATCC 11539]|uniref:F-box domain-containing protein n=1 Tax=Gloeophyllum trabeum (strain ATCC 11539 / FP-39264 / Madison 617) TaxID=670483 RepID=S7S4C1_GLOTA|nr:uncharacterized protein GLOTRDRAFT_90141 [Gloeophyllum trabeum ATCC 11539]EPQ60739.1 hypothetical protein GLOTRDRAFT_90141 [Gloeophyllum trabeum ATCC 11539]